MTLGNFWRALRGALNQSNRYQSRRRGRDGRSALLAPEQLEQRELLSVNQIVFDAANETVAIYGTTDADRVSVVMESTNVIRVRAESIDGVVEQTFAKSGVSSITFTGGDGDDRFENKTDIAVRALGQGGNDELHGGIGDDELLGGDGDDRLFGYQGNDRLLGEAGDDQLTGGDGDDELIGYDGDDWADGQAGNDKIVGGLGNDKLYGGTGADNVFGNEGDDTLYGHDGDDRLEGGDGQDWLFGGAGSDSLLGGAGNDTLLGGDGNDELHGQDGDDWADGQLDDDKLNGGLGNDTLYGGLGDDRLFGQEGSDTLHGNDGNDRLDGGDSQDVLFGDAGSDYLLGGAGNDTLYGGTEDDELHGQDGDDWSDGQAGNDKISGGLGNDTIYGGAGQDELIGNEGMDTLYGDDESDRLDGGDDADRLIGGAGSDFFLGGAGNDILVGGDGDDELFGQEGDDWIAAQSGRDILDGGLGNDTLYGGEGDDTISGFDGDDSIYGDDGSDRLIGGDGQDRILGGSQADYLLGGPGNDVLFGGDGDDELHGQDGDDWADGQAGIDIVTGGLGNDALAGGADNDSLTGDAGDDVLAGGEGDDVVLGGDGNDILFGDGGKDQLRGDAGSDFLNGGAGDDDLNGGVDNDALVGGTGRDQLAGGSGEDILIGATTAYDDNVAAIRTLMSSWATTAPYQARISLIEDDGFAARLKSNETVFDDGVADSIFGGTDDDWFFLTGYMGVYDPNLGAHSDGDSHDHSHPGNVVVDELPALEGFALIDSLDELGDRQSSEKLSTLIAHANDPVLQREHLALFQLVPYSAVTHYAVGDGAWSNPQTWANGLVPSDGAHVLIPIGVEVTVDRLRTEKLATVRIDGTLSFSADANTLLRVDTMVVGHSGRLEMGTPDAPIPSGRTAQLSFTDSGPIDRTADPFGLSRGLISHGSVSIYGAQVAPYASIIGSVSAGTNWLHVSSIPAGWKVGDTIVLASTTAGTEQNEVRQISAIVGNRVFVNQSFAYNHVPASAEFSVHAANTTRNVSISSEGSVSSRLGHVMFMHNRDVHIENAGFYRLGRTDKSIPINDPVVDSNWRLVPGTGTNPRARYAVHFHRNGLVDDGNPSTVSGSVVVDSPGWGFVNHSSFVDMSDNVAFDVNGAAFVTEVGDEIGSFRNNIAIGSTGSGEKVESRLDRQDFGHQGDGFWFQGPGITVVDNIAAGNTGNAFIYFTRGLIEGGTRQRFISANLLDPSIAGGDAEIDIEHVPVFEFENNIGYASGMGLNIWYHLRDATHGQQGTFENSTFWNNTNGITLPYTQNTILRNLKVVHVPDDTAALGIGMNVVTRDITYDNLTVTGYSRGVELPRKGYALVTGGTYQNLREDIVIFSAITADRVVTLNGLVGTPRIVMAPNFTPIDDSINHVFFNDTVIANYGPFVNQRLYYKLQARSAVPFPVAAPGVPQAYVGLRSQQLWNQFGIAIGGRLAPLNVIELPEIIGLIGLPI